MFKLHGIYAPIATPFKDGKIAYDLHRSAVVMVDDRTRLLQPMTDADETWVQHWISSVYGMDVPQQAVGRAIDLVAREHSTHPLRDWLDGLQWDGIDRLAELWPRYFGVNADEHALVCEYGTMWAIQAVARVRTDFNDDDLKPPPQKAPKAKGKAKGDKRK